jgi:hypothetical protein
MVPLSDFSTRTEWKSAIKRDFHYFLKDSALLQKLKAIVLNIVKFNRWLKFFLWLGVRTILRDILAKTVLKVIKTELRNWHLMK